MSVRCVPQYYPTVWKLWLAFSRNLLLRNNLRKFGPFGPAFGYGKTARESREIGAAKLRAHRVQEGPILARRWVELMTRGHIGCLTSPAEFDNLFTISYFS